MDKLSSELLSACKRNKDSWEKCLKKREEVETEKPKAKKQKKTKRLFRKRNSFRPQRKNSTNEKSPKRKMNLRPKRSSRWSKSSEEEDDPTVEELNPSVKREKVHFKGLKTKSQRRNQQWQNAISCPSGYGISSIVALLQSTSLSPLSTQKVIEFSWEQSGWSATLVWKSRIKEEDYTWTTLPS